MAARTKAEGAALLWERPEPPKRPAPEPLSRERIVTAAIALADRDGLEAVSLRNVAAALGAGPMRLYGYMESKDELLELMVDAVYGEMNAAGAPKGDWKTALRTLSHRTRDASKKHPWFVELLGGRPQLGPNALAHLEAGLAALSGAKGFDDIDHVVTALGTVNAYVVGAIRSEASELLAQRATGMTEKEWQEATGPYIERLIATGRFPTLARVVHDAKHPPADVVFEQGLDCVLDGIAASVKRAR
ncbi:TetR/AcrR family transcriptional regulator [Polyangium jinanense]|uniref:TetR/AcrR family transcriptional regulator n=1 Tax=Polyangium jinanense TaxID=2829994 RepID=A0A9X3X7M7_9BACT|nr:TetR/AcrR family transcriptional regulator [Polyangium jinanense]MDC3984250.1 TetR/AcrR family transcriptional regulator [Polyangium jinanense]